MNGFWRKLWFLMLVVVCGDFGDNLNVKSHQNEYCNEFHRDNFLRDLQKHQQNQEDTRKKEQDEKTAKEKIEWKQKV